MSVTDRRALLALHGFALRPLMRRAREHGVLGRHPADLLIPQERRHFFLHGGGADHLRAAHFHQHRPLGVLDEIPRNLDGPDFVLAPTVNPVQMHAMRHIENTP
jgi:hypothetical protein